MAYRTSEPDHFVGMFWYVDIYDSTKRDPFERCVATCFGISPEQAAARANVIVAALDRLDDAATVGQETT